ncbi:S8 family peptidase [Streptomyces sp. GD-15H]|uniref:S8 family peptidase n=1 Tax=Streptomyces sp. GD-15H TaxID=3129112 RepID=UPI00324EC74E
MSQNNTSDSEAQDHDVRERPIRWLVAPLPAAVLPQGVTPMEPDSVFDRLSAESDVQLCKRITPSERLQALSGDSGFPEVAVLTMTEERAQELNRSLEVHVERDHRLVYGMPMASPDNIQVLDPAARVPMIGGLTLAFAVRGSDGTPLPRAEVSLTGAAWPAQGVTGPDGRVVISLSGETPGSIRAVYVRPEHGYWDRWVVRPQLVPNADNVITLTRLDETVPGFPDRQMFGWGQKAMCLDRIPPTYRAHGIRIAVIDSGIATSHPDLEGRVAGGVDVAERKSWSVDVSGHGTHCAGTIAGADNGRGIIGSAAEAEIHACKIFPSGRLSDLLEALDYCIEHSIDVVNLSLGTREHSALVAHKIAAARKLGMACIAASGNNGGEQILFPGTLDTVLTVAAMGKTGEGPEDSSHAFQVFGKPTAEGYYSAKFSAYGPGVDLCAPGVAIVSSVPPANYAAQDGTSMAAPHVTSLAALVLAHHPDFQQRFSGRDEARVEHLFQILRDSCEPLDFGDPRRSGAGLPNAVRALGLDSSVLLGGLMPGAGTTGGFTRTSAVALVDELERDLERIGIV